MDLEVLRARLVADASQFVTELNAATGALGGPNGNGGLAGAATKSNLGMTTLRRGMVGLAMQATGTAGPIGRITQGLLLLGGGSGLLLGVAAGIGALSLVFAGLTRDARDNAAALKDMDDALTKLGAHGSIQSIRDQIADVKSQLDDPTIWQKLSQLGKELLGGMTGGLTGPMDAEGIRQALMARLTALRIALSHAEKDFLHPFTQDLADAKEALKESGLGMEYAGETATGLAERIRVLRLEYDHLTDKEAAEVAMTERLAAEHKAGADAFRSAYETLRESQITGSPDVREALIARQRALAGGVSQEISDRLAQMTMETRRNLRAIADVDEMRQIGIAAGKELIMGLAMGMESMQDFLKSVFNMLMDFTLGKIFGSLFGAIGGSIGGIGAGTQVTGSLGGNGISGARVAPSQMSLSLSGMPAATNPLAAARDAMWQVFLRESIITAKSQGFRS